MNLLTVNPGGTSGLSSRMLCGLRYNPGFVGMAFGGWWQIYR